MQDPNSRWLTIESCAASHFYQHYWTDFAVRSIYRAPMKASRRSTPENATQPQQRSRSTAADFTPNGRIARLAGACLAGRITPEDEMKDKPSEKLTLDGNSRVYIAGCGGMLGEAMYRLFSTRTSVKATDIDVNASWLEHADVRDYHQMRESVGAFRPHLLINLAALTDLEYCERNQENAWLTNAYGAENLALIADRLGIPMVQISTAGIFDGQQDQYNDFDAPNPLGIYAKSKYYGELVVQRLVREHFVFRAGWMMGGGEKKDKKFINKIYQQLKAGKRELFVVDDKLGTPTFTKSFAQGIFNVVQAGPFGLYNQVCEGNCSRFDVAVEFVRLLGLSEQVRVTKVSSDFFKDDYFAPRPASEKLVNLKLNARKLSVMPHWKDALSEYVKQFSAIDMGN